MKAGSWLQSSWLTWGLILLTLTGCEFVSQAIPQLPPLPSYFGQQSPAHTPAQSAATAKMEADVQRQINQIRQQHGLNQLRNNEQLAQVARSYSQQMAQQNFFSHSSPAGDRVGERVQAAGIFYLLVGENLFKCTNAPQPASLAVKGWMQSPGHRENILYSQYRETGIGVWRQGNTYYFTQLFLRSLQL